LTYDAMGQRDQAIKVLALATPEAIEELNRHPDLADFRRDKRFIQVVAQLGPRK
jgi:hypothetical protein